MKTRYSIIVVCSTSKSCSRTPLYVIKYRYLKQ